MKDVMDLVKAVGFITLAIFALIVAPIAGVIISTGLGIWLIFMIIKQHRTKDD